MFFFLGLFHCICFLFTKWVKSCCKIFYASLVCIVLMMDRTNPQRIVLDRCSSMWSCWLLFFLFPSLDFWMRRNTMCTKINLWKKSMI